MFPIGDDDSTRRTVPLVTYALIAVNLLFGVAATLAQLVFSVGSNVPNLGASGAIAGVLGAYILMFPKGQVKVLMGRGVIPMPALVVIGFWIVLQFISGFGSF